METAFQTVFIKKNMEAEGVFSFYFVKPENFSFLPGQYVDVTLVINGRDERYSFTLSSSPEEKDLVLTTRQSGSLYKKKLFSLKKGQLVAMRGPLGGFVINNEDTATLIFLSGGIGITPFRSMVLSLTASPKKYTIFLLASFSKKEDMIYYTEFQELMKQNKNIHIIYTLSKEDSPMWTREKGRISEELIKAHVPSFGDYHFFIAGGNDMVDDTVLLLGKMGVENKRIKTDTFTGY